MKCSRKWLVSFLKLQVQSFAVLFSVRYKKTTADDVYLTVKHGIIKLNFTCFYDNGVG